MITLLMLNTIIYFLETVKAYDHLKRTKDKGHDALTSQPLKPSTELKSNDL